MASSLEARKPLGEITVHENTLNSRTIYTPEFSKKRKSFDRFEYYISNETRLTADISCDAVRAKIRQFIENGDMKVGEFQKAIGASSSTYGAFMRQSGSDKGKASSVYSNAFTFFKMRELNGIKIKKRKIDTLCAPGATAGVKAASAIANTDFGDIVLEDEEENEVPVYDSCDEIRKKIRAYLAKTSMSQAQFSRELGNMVHPNKASVSGLALFLGKKGPAAGNTSQVFYCSYVFFEKLRIRDKKPKTEHRFGMEDAWDGCEPWGKNTPGMEVKKMIDREVYIGRADADYELYQDEFGKAVRGWRVGF